MSQLTFNLPFRKTLGRDDFLVSECNKVAVGWVDAWPDWPFHMMLIWGDSGCGKTHLGHIFSNVHIDARDLNEEDFAGYPEKIVVENADKGVSETALFHLYNYAKESGKFVMVTAQKVPEFKLPDLASRMKAMLKVKIEAPDDELLFALLVKGFAERGIVVPVKVLEYVIQNSQRSFAAVQTFLDAADRLSLAEKRAITVPLVKTIIGK